MATTTGGLKKREKTDFLKSVVFFKRSIWSKKKQTLVNRRSQEVGGQVQG